MVSNNIFFIFIFSGIIYSGISYTLSNNNITIWHCIGFASGIQSIVILISLGISAFNTNYNTCCCFLSIITIFTIIYSTNFTSCVRTSCDIRKTTIITSFFTLNAVSIRTWHICDSWVFELCGSWGVSFAGKTLKFI